MENTNIPANELGTDESTTENAVTEAVKIKSIWTTIDKKESDQMLDLTEAFETTQGVVIRNTLVQSEGSFTSTMAFIPAVKVVELADGSLTIK